MRDDPVQVALLRAIAESGHNSFRLPDLGDTWRADRSPFLAGLQQMNIPSDPAAPGLYDAVPRSAKPQC